MAVGDRLALDYDDPSFVAISLQWSG